MAEKKTLLSRFFRADSKEKEDEAKEQDFEEWEDETPKARGVDPYLLELPPDHAIWQLWRIRKDQTEWLPVPILRMEASLSQQESLSKEDLKGELSYLEKFVTDTAQERLQQAQPEKETLEPEQKPEQALEGEPQEGLLEEEPPCPDLDADVEVFLSWDKLSAWLLVYPPVGKGRELDREMLNNALEKKKVTYGIIGELLDNLPDNPERYFRLYLAAQGEQVTHGIDGSVKDLFPRVKKQRPKVREFERVNYAELDLVYNVKKGDVICKIIAPIPGKPGKTVLGKEIPAKDGKAAEVPKGRNTELSDDGKCLVAAREGHVEFIGQTFQVKPVLEITGNVDYSIGNVLFLGDVHIRGDVCSGFIVRAMGDVTVDGVVQGCTIETGGDLLVVKGVKGDNQSVLQVHQSLYTKYLESALVCVNENVQTDCIINSIVYSDGVVDVCSGRGIIVGGKVWAASEVRANVIGSRSGNFTSICLGGVPSQHFEYERLLREMVRLEEEIEKLERQPDSVVKLKNLPDLQMKLSVDKNKLKQFDKYLEEEPEEEKQEEPKDSRRLVCGTAFPGTEIMIDDVSLRLDREVQQCTAMLVKGEVSLMQLQQ